MDKHFRLAIVRKPARNFMCGLTTSNLGTPRYDLAVKQHHQYIATLESLGIEVICLDAQPDHPDAHFVEDTAIVTPDVAVISLSGAKVRRGEEDSIAAVLEKYRKTIRIHAPGTLDGGDVLMLGNHFFIGVSERTNPDGARQLGRILEDYGNTWDTVTVGSGLHLKSAVNYVGKNTLIVTEEFEKLRLFEAYGKVVVDHDEAYAANTLWLNNHLLMPEGFPNTKKKLQSLEIDIVELAVSEMRKMDGGLTCLSLRF